MPITSLSGVKTVGSIENIYNAYGGAVGLAKPDPRANAKVNALRAMGEVISKRKITISSKVHFDQVQYPNYGEGDIWQIAAAVGSSSGSSSGTTSNQIKFGIANQMRTPPSAPPTRPQPPRPMIREYRSPDISYQIEAFNTFTQIASFRPSPRSKESSIGSGPADQSTRGS